jgi:hypothetical protein
MVIFIFALIQSVGSYPLKKQMNILELISNKANKSIQRTVKSGISLRYTLLLTATDARR